MHQTLSAAISIAGITALHTLGGVDSAVSQEAKCLSNQKDSIVTSFDLSWALFAPKSEALSQLTRRAAEHANSEQSVIHPIIMANAESFLRVLSADIDIPDINIEPDGNISLDWMKSPTQVFSLSIGVSNRVACAWIDGAKNGFFVEVFHGKLIPERIKNEILLIGRISDASIHFA
jgi:hypothetical protein